MQGAPAGSTPIAVTSRRAAQRVPGGGEGADAGLQEDDVDRGVSGELSVDLGEQRRVPVDHPARDIARAFRVCIVDGAAGRIRASIRDRQAHRLVVVAVDLDELCSLGDDRLAPYGPHRARNVDRGCEPDQRGHARDRTTVVAIGRRGEAVDPLRPRSSREGRHVGASAEQPRNRPRGTEELERRQAEAPRLVLHVEAFETELARERRGGNEPRLLVPRQAAVERERARLCEVARAVPVWASR